MNWTRFINSSKQCYWAKYIVRDDAKLRPQDCFFSGGRLAVSVIPDSKADFLTISICLSLVWINWLPRAAKPLTFKH
jgi:hypothetical protein